MSVAQVNYCGTRMINARRVEAIVGTWIRYGNQTFRGDRRGRHVGFPFWQFGR